MYSNKKVQIAQFVVALLLIGVILLQMFSQIHYEDTKGLLYFLLLINMVIAVISIMQSRKKH
ncbi:hypothetical protein [Marinilactibacillus kalidii]|uniref:hypothetical protein n=1 Tax=Marinilactibacillus kalidii TaxID=2820274 RepID=UPI001ABDFCB5|nr:hypothetical protein [Marinilactibacillus kalidii]